MRRALLFGLICLVALSPRPAIASDGPDTPAASPEDPAYTRVVEKRAADLIAALGLDDSAKASRVRTVVIDQYRGLSRLHDARDSRIRALKDRPGPDRAELARRIEAERASTVGAASALNDRFLATLSADLSPAQVAKVKDQMTYNKLPVTYDAYLDMLPDLTAAQKRVILDTLTEARDRATYAGSAEEKSEVFSKYKGRVNNYLSAQGYDLKQAARQRAERPKPAK